MSWNDPSSSVSPVASLSDERVSSFLSKVYGYMFAGLLITAGVAYAIASSELVLTLLVGNRLLIWAVIFAQFGAVIALSSMRDRLTPLTAAAVFIVYSALVGVTTSVIFLVFTAGSIAQTFIVTAGMFGATAVFGTVTKRSLAGLGQFMFMGLIGLILAMIVGLFWQSDALQFVITIVGVLVFTGLTAWDAQNMRQLALAMPDGREGTYAVVGALSLYLDFVNLFFFLLRLTGRRN